MLIALSVLLALTTAPGRPAQGQGPPKGPPDEAEFQAKADEQAADEARFYNKAFAVYRIQTPAKGKVASTSVIGEVQVYRIRQGDTLMDLAREYSLGYNEIVEANPGIDPWVPPAGATILLPTSWVLPCCDYTGVIINIPEMRLFHFAPDSDGTTRIQTYPVGLGRDDWRTPRGKFKISGKTVNPQWNIPESIRKEHIAERGDPRTFIPGGAPDNPLGSRRLELTLPMYRIHGTNIPWGVGMQVSHGCVRLYPEDIEHYYPTVRVGTPGEFAYQPVKIGMRNGVVWAESQSDIYGYSPALYRDTRAEIEKLGIAHAVDERLLIDGLSTGRGLPFRISPGGQGATLERFDLLPDES
jgi:L,D-transpeptidase ErfK/SrfK